jgi:hypothetical protein
LISNRSSGFCFMNSLHTSRPNKFSKKTKYSLSTQVPPQGPPEGMCNSLSSESFWT